MKISISNIAWDTSEDGVIASLLNRYDVGVIDIAPGKYFPDPGRATDQEIERIKKWWAVRGIKIVGMQALLFGTVGLNIFASLEVQEAMLLRLREVCRIASGLGAKHLVFGSPKNRNCAGLSECEAMSVAVPFFRHLGEIAFSYGVVICVEPNPACYGANFMTNSAETLRVVKEVAHPAIKMQFDSGSLSINHEDPKQVLQDCASFIGHVHISEPGMLPIGDGGVDHSTIADYLERYLPNHTATIEMLETKNEPHPIAIERAIRATVQHYRKKGEV
jgi:sugar phosphate isomerase/epimerase